jgi:hypothetical protein
MATTRSKAAVLHAALAPNGKIGKVKGKDDGYTLPTKLSTSVINRQKKLLNEENKHPVTDEAWHQFFSDYLDDIYKNIDKYLSILPQTKGGVTLTHAHLDIIKLEIGGFDEEFRDTSNQDKLKFNLGLYRRLFEQFKNKINPVFGCHRLNQLLSWIGVAVLKLFEDYNKKSPLDIIGFCRKIVVILELSVYPEVFFKYMTGTTTGNKLRSELNKNPGYSGIWLRKQEFLGFISSQGKDWDKKYDSGLRIFVRNYIRRLIGYMRTFDEDYPLGYAPIYMLNNEVHTYPLGKNGKPQVNPNPPTDYIISREDWDYIPNFLLPEGEAQLSYQKNHKIPEKWRHPPPDWWIDRTMLLLDYAWWKNSDDTHLAENIKRLRGTKELAKWKALNHMEPKSYKYFKGLWEQVWKYDMEEDNAAAGAGPGAASGIVTKMPGGGNKFQIFKDKDIALSKELCDRLKSKLLDYRQLDDAAIAATAATTTNKVECYLRDNNYINNLKNLNNSNNSIIYSQNNKADLLEHVSKILKIQASARHAIPSKITTRRSSRSLRIAAPGLEKDVINRPIGFPTLGPLEPVIEISSNKKKLRNTGSSAASSAGTVKASSRRNTV